MTAGLVPVPTCAELGARGLASNRTRTIVDRDTGDKRDETRWEITDAGYAALRAALAHNGRVGAAAEAAREPEVEARRVAARARHARYFAGTTNHTDGGDR